MNNDSLNILMGLNVDTLCAYLHKHVLRYFSDGDVLVLRRSICVSILHFLKSFDSDFQNSSSDFSVLIDFLDSYIGDL